MHLTIKDSLCFYKYICILLLFFIYDIEDKIRDDRVRRSSLRWRQGHVTPNLSLTSSAVSVSTLNAVQFNYSDIEVCANS